MTLPKDPIRQPTKEEYEQIQEDHPNTTIIPQSRADFERIRGEVRSRMRDEEENSLLKPTSESLEVFAAHLEAKRSHAEFIDKIESTPIKDAITSWLSNLNDGTRRNYGYYMSDMIRRRIIPDLDARGNVFTVGHFNHVPHELSIDYIKKVEDWTEGTRQVRAACYISFTSYLHRITQGWFRKAEPSTLPSNKTFYNERDKCATEALSEHDVHRVLSALNQVSERDSLIVGAMLQGAKRVSEVLQVKMGQLDDEKRIIRFRQNKSGGLIKEIPITFPESYWNRLKEYIIDSAPYRSDDGADSYLFVTRRGRPIHRNHVNAVLAKVSERLGMSKVTPHQMRATWVTIAKTRGVADTEVMKVTGHTSAKMVLAYDKTSDEDNFSKNLVLV